MWCVVLVLLLLCQIQIRVCEFDDDRNVIIVPLLNYNYPEQMSHFRFLATDTNVAEKCESFCIEYALDMDTCNKVLIEAKGRQAQWWEYESSTSEQKTKYYNDYMIGVPTHQQDYPLLKTNYCFVTAFFELGRTNWSTLGRPAEKYLLYFSKLLQINIPLIVFIDDRYYSDLTQLINQFNYRSSHIVLIRINERFLEQHIRSWQYLSSDEAIMASSQYKTAVFSRPRVNTPETLYPRYTCFNHAKIDFMMYTINNNIALTSYHSGSGDSVSSAVRTVDYLGWIDFGYVRHNDAILPFVLNTDLLMESGDIRMKTRGGGGGGGGRGAATSETETDTEEEEVEYVTVHRADVDSDVTAPEAEYSADGLLNGVQAAEVSSQGDSLQSTTKPEYRIHCMQTEHLAHEDGDPLYTLSNAPDRILGGFIFGYVSVLQRYSELYHRSVSELHSRGIADDDQAIMAHLYWKEPGLFKLWRNLNLIEGVHYQGVYVVQLLFNKRIRERDDVKAFIEANRD